MMLIQTLCRKAPSASLIMAATGSVCPKKKAAVARASVSGSEAQLLLPFPACQARPARLAAKAIMLTLKTICSALNFLWDAGQHCTSVEMQAIEMASAALKFTTARRRNGRLTDILPLIPGSLTFIREVAAARASTARV